MNKKILLLIVVLIVFGLSIYLIFHLFLPKRLFPSNYLDYVLHQFSGTVVDYKDGKVVVSVKQTSNDKSSTVDVEVPVPSNFKFTLVEFRKSSVAGFDSVESKRDISSIANYKGSRIIFVMEYRNCSFYIKNIVVVSGGS